MSIYTFEEVCRDCENSIYCGECGKLHYCAIDAMNSVDHIRGKCPSKETADALDTRQRKAT